MKHLIIVCVLAADCSASLLMGAPAFMEKTADQSAVDAARDYTSMLKTGKGAAAIEKYWDTDAMVQAIFGEHLKQQSADEVKQIDDLWLGFLKRIHANPQTLAALKEATFSDFKAAEEDDGKSAIVTYQTHLGDKVFPNKLRFVKEEEGWRIVDIATNGQLFVETLQKAYERQAKKVTPLKFMQALAAQSPAASSK